MEEKKISEPKWNSVKREELEKQKRLDIEKVAKITPPDLKVNPAIIDEKKKESPRNQIKKQIEVMHKEALSRTLGLDKPEPERCSSCFSVLQGTGYIVNSGIVDVFCRKCFQSLKRCFNCKRPVKQNIKGMATQYCEFCKSQKTCTSCGCELSPKEGKRIEGVRGFYCSNCVSSIKCHFCGVPAVNESYKISAKAVICKDCVKKAVAASDKAIEILEKVRGDIFERYGIRVSKPFKIGLATLDDINENDVSKKEIKVLHQPESVFLVFVLGLPVERVKYHIAYEICRSFISEYLSNLQTDEMYNGFAKYVSYYYLDSLGYVLEAENIKKDNNYKTEFQHFFKLERKLGFKKIISTIKSGKMPLCI